MSIDSFAFGSSSPSKGMLFSVQLASQVWTPQLCRGADRPPEGFPRAAKARACACPRLGFGSFASLKKMQFHGPP